MCVGSLLEVFKWGKEDEAEVFLKSDYLAFHATAKATSPVCSVSKPNNL